ncbi:hypothetical protein ACT3CD_00160 [Geofilum sp. OHC36d9]|uniref:hypothetical protein n=1 Tax=Geofilum sp. OHC36d9 TaxID=3458413 RepID=UPI004033C6B1
MKNFLSKYLSLILLGVIIIISLTTLFRVPNNLKQAIETISSAEKKIDSSILILKNQNAYLDSLIIINENLLLQLDTLRDDNTQIAKSINDKLKTAKWYLNKIKAEVEKLPAEFETIN